MAIQRRPGGEPVRGARQGTATQERWDEILQAAAEEFYERGFRGARLKDIAERAGLLTGSLYYYIDSKEDLLFGLVESTHRLGLATTVEDAETRVSDAPTRLRRFLGRQLTLMHDLEASVGAVQRDLPLLAPEQRAKILEMRQHLHDFMRGILEQGIAEGHFDPRTDLGAATNSIFGMLSRTPEWAARDGRLSWAEIGDWYSRLVIRGLATTTPQS